MFGIDRCPVGFQQTHEARIAKKVEASQKMIRKEFQKEDALRRKCDFCYRKCGGQLPTTGSKDIWVVIVSNACLGSRITLGGVYGSVTCFAIRRSIMKEAFVKIREQAKASRENLQVVLIHLGQST
ncbi:hypothetical protein Tco_0917781 [Tanacetum coccineum]